VHARRAMALATEREARAAARERAAAVYCKGPLLDAVQRLRVFEDGKHFVDMPMRKDPEDILSAFEQLSAEAKADAGSLRDFVAEHFFEPGSELVELKASQIGPEIPPFLEAGKLRDENLREFAVALHRLWPTLCRVTASSVTDALHRTSALPREHAMVLPGGRFRETYYWDSLWIIHGLLSSGMRSVARGLVQNLLGDVHEFGFVPNGGRIYYLNRSQPPMLHAMVAAVVEDMDEEEAVSWLPDAFEGLKREYEWWMSAEHGHMVQVGPFKLNRYYAHWDGPRPESYWEDLVTAGGSVEVYRELASVAETGWDFSARWSRAGGCAGSSGYELRTSEVTSVLPVDLNAMMYSFERTLAAMAEAVATGGKFRAVAPPGATYEDPTAAAFSEAATQRRHAFDTLFWRKDRWVDLWLPDGGPGPWPADVAASAHGGARAATLADFAVPLWARLADECQASAIVGSLADCGLLGPGGLATTSIASGQQWDAPNAWPPLQSMLIEGLEASGAPGSAELALDIARRWVGTCLVAWKATGFMHEKYDADEFGKGGAGGEYEPQVGFGWSNGVALQLLELYGDRLIDGKA